MVAGITGPARQLTVPFVGERSGAFPLTWAQGNIWCLRQQIPSQQAHLNFQHLLRVPPDCAVGDVTRALGRVVEQHEALRTTVDVDGSGEPRQVVHGRGELSVEVVDAGAAELRQVVADVWDRHLNRSFEDGDLPLRPALVTSSGRPMALVLAASHLMLDWYALMTVADDLDGLLRGVELEAPAWQPVDQAEAEASPRGQRLAERSIAFWRDHLRTAPPTMFPVTLAQPERLWPCAELRSPALALAARALAGRHRQSPADVVLAAAALVLGLRAGTPSTVLRIVTANRFTPELRRMVGTCVQTGLLVVDLTDCSFSAFLERTWAASMRALRHSRYPEPALRRALATAGRERRTTIDLSAFFHNMTEGEPVVETDGRAPTQEALAEATTRTALRPGAVFPRWRRFTLEVRDAAEGMELYVEADPTAMSRQDAATFVRSVEKLVVHAVHDDFPLTAARALADPAAVHR